MQKNVQRNEKVNKTYAKLNMQRICTG